MLTGHTAPTSLVWSYLKLWRWSQKGARAAGRSLRHRSGHQAVVKAGQVNSKLIVKPKHISFHPQIPLNTGPLSTSRLVQSDTLPHQVVVNNGLPKCINGHFKYSVTFQLSARPKPYLTQLESHHDQYSPKDVAPTLPLLCSATAKPCTCSGPTDALTSLSASPTGTAEL